jgi:hypothetical protein
MSGQISASWTSASYPRHCLVGIYAHSNARTKLLPKRTGSLPVLGCQAEQFLNTISETTTIEKQ